MRSKAVPIWWARQIRQRDSVKLLDEGILGSRQEFLQR